MCVPMVAAQVLEWVSVVEVAPVDLINYIGHINVLKVHHDEAQVPRAHMTPYAWWVKNVPMGPVRS